MAIIENFGDQGDFVCMDPIYQPLTAEEQLAELEPVPDPYGDVLDWTDAVAIGLFVKNGRAGESGDQFLNPANGSRHTSGPNGAWLSSSDIIIS